MDLIVAITGASGVILGVRLLEFLKKLEDVKTHLIISDWGERIMKIEVKRPVKEVKRLADYVYDNRDLTASLSSGSVKFDGMVVIPCSAHTLSMIANGLANDLITRAAAVSLKENRKLILVVRETPLSSIHILNMLRASRAGAVILPPVLTFYHGPISVEDLVDYVVGKTLDQLGVKHDLYRRWSGVDAEKRSLRKARD